MKNLKKLILGIGIVGIIFSGSILADSEINNEDEKLSQDYINYLNLSDEEKQKVEIIPEKYDVDYDEFFSKYSDDNNNEDSLPIDGSTTIPTSFDLRKKFKINVENQGSEGNCWIFATLGAMRTHLALKNSLSVTPNLSERHLDYLTSNLYTDKNFLREQGAGGNFTYSLRYFMNNDGPVLESKVPYSNSYSTAAELKKLDAMTPDYYVHKIVSFPTIKVKNGLYYNGSKQLTDAEVTTFRNQVKKHIMNNGGVYCSIRTNSKFADSGNKHYNQFDDGSIDRSECGGHAITIIGWDDNYSRNNFYGAFKPKKNGAWLVVNNYGENWGYNGTQWISYEDYRVNSDLHGFLSVDKTLRKVSQTFSNQKLYNALKKCYTDASYSVTSNDTSKTLSIIDLIDNVNTINVLNLSNLELTDEDLNQLTTFSFPKVNRISVSSNKITTINSLYKYRDATTLDIGYNNISSIGVVSQFENLATLTASSNNITNIDCLSSLQNLKTLYISNNQIASYHLADTSKYSTFNLLSQKLTFSNKLEDGSYEVAYPDVILRSKDKDDKLYTPYGMKYVGCKETSDGKGILVDKTAKEVYVFVKGGNLGSTKFSITNYDKLKKGDINKDGKVDLLDVFLSYNKNLKYASGSELKWEELILTDFNGDEKVDLLDVYLVYNKYLKESK